METWLSNMCEQVKKQTERLKHRLKEVMFSSSEGYSLTCVDCGCVVVVGHSYDEAMKRYNKSHVKKTVQK